MKVSVGQFSPTGDVAENIETMRRLAAAAAREGSGLILFPEEAMFTVGKVDGISGRRWMPAGAFSSSG